jgi:hypothetical protein
LNRLRGFLLLLFSLGAVSATHGQEFNYKVNAMYVYYFTKYVNWPQHTADEIITVGVIGESDVFGELQAIVAKKKTGPLILIRKIEPHEAAKYKMVVVSKSSSHLLKHVEQVTRNLPVLIVSEKQGLTTKGAAIAIYVDDEDSFKTKFEISKQNIHSRGLKVSHELMALAEIVN